MKSIVVVLLVVSGLFYGCHSQAPRRAPAAVAASNAIERTPRPPSRPVSPEPSAPPATPAQVKVERSTAYTLTVGWTGVAGATSYRVSRDTSPNGRFVTGVYSGSRTRFTDSGLRSGTTYYYRVEAVNASGATSTPTAPAAATTIKLPTEWTGLVVSADGEHIAGSLSNGAIAVSGNGGKTWTRSTHIFAAGVRKLLISNDGRWLVALTGGYVDGRRVPPIGFSLSSDGGRSWRPETARELARSSTDGGILPGAAEAQAGNRSEPHTAAPNERESLIDLAMSRDGRRLAVTSTEALYLSADAGRSWTRYHLPAGSKVGPVAIGPEAHTLAVALQPSYGKVFVPGVMLESSDYGATWSRQASFRMRSVSLTLTGSPPELFTLLAADVAPNPGPELAVAAWQSSTMTAVRGALLGPGGSVSVDRNLIFANGRYRVSLSSDGGKTWASVSTYAISKLYGTWITAAAWAGSHGLLFVACNDGNLYESPDLAKSWTKLPTAGLLGRDAGSIERVPGWGDRAMLEALKNQDVAFIQKHPELANVRIGASDGSSPPIEYAVAMGRPKLVDALIRAGADVNATDTYRNAPLELAVEHRDVAIVKLLLDAHADVNAVDRFGRTPLFAAISSGSVEMVRLLIAAKADINYVAKPPQRMTVPGRPQMYTPTTPLMAAKARNNPDIIRMLEDAGAR